MRPADEGAAVAAAKAGDESAFAGLVERCRRELQVPCYRMLGSFEDSEDLQATLIDMAAADFTRPVTTGLTSNFFTARAAARHMVEQGATPMMGGTGPADAATETLMRYLAAEVGRTASASSACTPP